MVTAGVRSRWRLSAAALTGVAVLATGCALVLNGASGDAVRGPTLAAALVPSAPPAGSPAPVGTGAAKVAASAQTAPASDPALALQADFVKVVKAVRPSVVEITTSSGLGSGVVFDTRGDIVTNAHVVGSDTTFTVTFADGRRASAALVGTYAPDDLAVIRAQGAGKIRPAQFGDSSTAQAGTIVMAIGNPLGLSSSVTEGIVSFNGRAVDEGNGTVLADMVQTSAAINPGNSGGALANLSGKVIGVPTLAASAGAAAAPGLGFAIPSNTVKLIVPQLVAQGKVTKAGRAALGVSVTDGYDFSGAAIGALLTAVRPGGPAAQAGLVAGDLVVSLAGQPTPTASALQSVLATLKPGAKVTVKAVKVDGSQLSAVVVLGDLAQI